MSNSEAGCQNVEVPESWEASSFHYDNLIATFDLSFLTSSSHRFFIRLYLHLLPFLTRESYITQNYVSAVESFGYKNSHSTVGVSPSFLVHSHSRAFVYAEQEYLWFPLAFPLDFKLHEVQLDDCKRCA